MPFFTKKQKPVVRILDSPVKVIITPTFIAAPLPDGKILIIHGAFETTTDEMAAFHIMNAMDTHAPKHE